MISHLDRDVGRILALLKELSIDEHDCIFTSDNGAELAAGLSLSFLTAVGR